jgi:glycosyltransferase involved in cell wall biosynthesis
VTVIAAFPHYPHGNIPKQYKWKPFKIEQMEELRVIRTLMPPIKSVGFFRRLVLMGFFTVSSLFAVPFVGDFDAVWASSWAPGYIYGKMKRKPLALNVDDLTLEDLVDLELVKENSLVLKIGVAVYRLFYVKGNTLTVVSQGYTNIISSKYCVDPNRIHFVRGGVDLAIFKPNATPADASKEFVVLYSGAFSVAYDFEQIFKAAKIIEPIDKDIKFVIQGTGELLDSMRNSLRQMGIKNVKIQDEILNRTEVAKILNSADALILPLASFYTSGKSYRGMSSKLYEYQAVGKPIICCSKGVPSTYVEQTHSGVVVTPGDSKTLARMVLVLKRNLELCKTMGENGRKYVEREASIESIGSRTKEIFESQLCIMS